MSDRIQGFIVTLEKDLHEADSVALANAMRRLRGVLSVDPVVADVQSYISTERVRREYMRKLLDVLS